MSIWVIVALAGLLTFATRLSFVMLLGRLALPDWFKRALRFVPIAVLSAIILPALLDRGNGPEISAVNPQIWAGMIAVLVAWRSRNVLLTIAAGMAALLVLQFVFGMR